MKPKILRLCSIVLLLLFMGASCQKDEIEYADESIVIGTFPGISIYKTHKDYSDKLTVGLDSYGEVSSTPLFGYDTLIVSKKKNGEYVLKNRHFLKSGYILEDIYLDHAFTDISITEMVSSFSKYGANYWTMERFVTRTIDKDPFSDFYYLDSKVSPKECFTIRELNNMIESGSVETIFKKLK